MGSGIAQVAAQTGFTTVQFDVDPHCLEKSRISIQNNLKTQVDKNKISNDDSIAVLNRLSFTTDIQQCVGDIIVEAIIEKAEAKIDLFAQLSSLNGPQTILATNTSSLSITSLAAAIDIPERVIGMHFFNPAPVMKLVEVIKGTKTGDDVISIVSQLAIQMGKEPVICKDSPGFIVNRVARHYYLEGLKLLEEGVASPETIDKVLEGAGFKMGPFKLMDLIGIDINYNVSSIIWEALGRPERFTPSSIQKNKVLLGELGRKTGKGFYSYN
jgi:3-hydroxybutyryl-CoA dehydrogenase